MYLTGDGLFVEGDVEITNNAAVPVTVAWGGGWLDAEDADDGETDHEDECGGGYKTVAPGATFSVGHSGANQNVNNDVDWYEYGFEFSIGVDQLGDPQIYTFLASR